MLSFQMLQISFNKILFQKKPPHALVILFELRIGKKLLVKMKTCNVANYKNQYMK